MTAKSNRQQEVVKRILDTKAVDFNAIGKTVAEIGPAAAVADEPWDEFCWTMRTFIHLFRRIDTVGSIEDLGELSRQVGNLRQQ